MTVYKEQRRMIHLFESEVAVERFITFHDKIQKELNCSKHIFRNLSGDLVLQKFKRSLENDE